LLSKHASSLLCVLAVQARLERQQLAVRTATASTHSKLLALEAFRALLQLVVLDDSRDCTNSCWY
jgi:hypothetical protein